MTRGKPVTKVERRVPTILLLVKGLGLGGAERLLARSIPHLDRTRFNYKICYLTPWKDDLVGEFEQARIPTFCLDIANELSPVAAFRLARLLRREAVDLIHSHSPYPAVLARLVSPFTAVRGLVHTEHSLPASRRALTEIANRFTRRVGDRTIAVSNEVARALPGREEIDVIHGGVDLEAMKTASETSDARVIRSKLGIPDSHLVVGNVAHLRSQKNLELFLEAASQILAERGQASFVIVGREKEEGYQARLEALTETLGIAPHIFFTGFRSDPYPYVAAFDVFMMSSRYEGFPIALVEAMAMGKAVVATDVGGVSEAITNEETGLLVESGDSDALAKGVLRLLENEADRHRLGRRAEEVVHERFSMPAMVSAVEAVYGEVLG